MCKKIYSSHNRWVEIEEGLAQFLDIPESFYLINVGYKEIVWKDAIRLNQSMKLNVELDCSLTLTILNISFIC